MELRALAHPASRTIEFWEGVGSVFSTGEGFFLRWFQLEAMESKIVFFTGKENHFLGRLTAFFNFFVSKNNAAKADNATRMTLVSGIWV